MADSHSTLIRDCTKCGMSKPLTEFHRARRGLYGHQAFCKECASAMARKRYEAKGEEINAKTLAKYHARQEPIRQEKAKQKESRLAIPSKLCAKCKHTKDKALFGKASDRPDGLKPYCKECSALVSKESRYRNIESSKKSARDYYDRNKEKKLSYGKAWRESNKERFSYLVKDWTRRNKDRSRQNGLRYSRRIDQKIKRAFSSRIRRSIAKGKAKKKTIDIIGYSMEILMNHLERQFAVGMNWNNYGDWHIDHITPLSSFNITSYDCSDFRLAWALPNLRPLWAKDNMRKGKRITHLL